jgi:hypothetical protein
MKINKAILEKLIMEELDNLDDDLDEGLWSTLKGIGRGAGNFLAGFGYKRGKAASALLSLSERLEDARWEFIDDIEGLFVPIGSDVVKLPPDLKDAGAAWNDALKSVEQASDSLKKLASEIRSGASGPTKRRKAIWDQDSEQEQSPTPTNRQLPGGSPPDRRLPAGAPAEE